MNVSTPTIPATDGKFVPTMDQRTEASGFRIGQTVRCAGTPPTPAHFGRVIGFAPAFHTGDTVFIRFRDLTLGNRGHGVHSCGNTHVFPVPTPEGWDALLVNPEQN